MDQEFIDIITRMAKERGAAILVDGTWKKWIADYTGSQYPKETDLLKRILNEKCAEYINSATDVPERKQALLKRLEDDSGISPKKSADYLDLLGLLLKGDKSKCGTISQTTQKIPAALPSSPTTLTMPARKSPLLTVGICITLFVVILGAVFFIRGRGATKDVVGQAESDTITTAMVRIPGGTFMMGSPASEAEREDDETQHQVTVGGFSIGKYPVTVADFRRFTDSSGYKTEAETDGGGYIWNGSSWETKGDTNWKNPYISQEDNHPVVQISWNDAVQYCNWLSREEGLEAAYTISGDTVKWNRKANGYRLPTEAEWEYACRAGTTTPFNTGNNITTSQANYDGNYPYNGNAKGTYLKKTTPVGSYAPNGWGLYDMHGNVWEWCWDWYDEYSTGSQTDPLGASSGSDRVDRGGSWGHYGQYLRSAYRINDTPSYRSSYLGFRLARP